MLPLSSSRYRSNHFFYLIAKFLGFVRVRSTPAHQAFSAGYKVTVEPSLFQVGTSATAQARFSYCRLLVTRLRTLSCLLYEDLSIFVQLKRYL